MISKNTFKKNNRLLKKSDFKNLRRGSKLYVSDVLLFYKKENNLKRTRIGFAISKKYGKANKRNKIKRLLRDNFRRGSFKSMGYDVLITLNYKKIKKDHLKHFEIESKVSLSMSQMF